MANKSLNSMSRRLRVAGLAEVVLLAVSGFFLFTEHRAHYLGALPYALAVVAVTICLWLQLETREIRQKPGTPSSQDQSEERRQAP